VRQSTLETNKKSLPRPATLYKRVRWLAPGTTLSDRTASNAAAAIESGKCSAEVVAADKATAVADVASQSIAVARNGSVTNAMAVVQGGKYPY
jgi:hypothetical protein